MPRQAAKKGQSRIASGDERDLPASIPRKTFEAELRYKEASHVAEISRKDEELRQLHVKITVLDGTVDDLRGELQDERDASRALQAKKEELQSTTKKLEERFKALDELSKKAIDGLLAAKNEIKEMRAKQDNIVSAIQAGRDHVTLMKKLQPVIEKMKAEAEEGCAEVEKLEEQNARLQEERESLERKVASLEDTLLEERQLAAKAASHKDRLAAHSKQHEKQMKKLQTEKEKAEKDLERLRLDLDESHEETKQSTIKVEELRKALKEAKSVIKEQVSTLEEELAKEKKQRLQATKNEKPEQLKDLQKRLEQAERDAAAARSEFETERDVLNDKLNAFRTKLRSTKEKLKETETELEEARLTVPTKSSITAGSMGPPMNPRKRHVLVADPDATLGTPGDGGPAKKTKRAPSVLGEKSTFSITPFLNRNKSGSLLEINPDHPIASIEDTDSPAVRAASARPAAAAASNRKPLASSPNKANLKVAPKPVPNATEKKQKRPIGKSSLASVVEEDPVEEEEGEDEPREEEVAPKKTQPAPVAEAQPPAKELKKVTGRTQLKPKALSSYQSFREGSIQSQPGQKPKKRKLLGGGPTTLFDDDDEEEDADATTISNAFTGKRAFGALGAVKAGKGFTALGKKKNGLFVVKENGFMFSPLKKDRRAAANAAA